MKTQLSIAALLASLCIASQAREITLTVNSIPNHGATITSDEVLVGTNEVAQVRSLYGPSSTVALDVVKNGITNTTYVSPGDGFGALHPVGITIAGPATIRLSGASTLYTWFCSIRIEPESFPPGQTIILPEGTVGVVHVESSTNLVQWQDEWTQTFSNTNANRFFRLRAERSLP